MKAAAEADENEQNGISNELPDNIDLKYLARELQILRSLVGEQGRQQAVDVGLLLDLVRNPVKSSHELSSSQQHVILRSIEDVNIVVQIILKDSQGSELDRKVSLKAVQCSTLSQLQAIEMTQWLPSFWQAYTTIWSWCGEEMLLEETMTASDNPVCRNSEIIYGDWFKRNVAEGTRETIGIMLRRDVVKTNVVAEKQEVHDEMETS